MLTYLQADAFDAAMLGLRLVLGCLVSFHGYIKYASEGGIEARAQWFDGIGMRPGRVHARVAAWSLMLSGGCVALGLLTVLAGSTLVGVMAVAWWTFRRGKGVLAANGGWEFVLVLGGLGAFLPTVGPGRLSVDHHLGITWQGLTAGGAAVIGGLLGAVVATALWYRPTPPSITGGLPPDASVS